MSNYDRHKHRVSRRTIAHAYTSPVAGGPFVRRNPKAHGSVSWGEICSCGAERKVNANQGHIERGAWLQPDTEEP